MKTLGFEQMNNTFRFGDCSELMKEFILTVGRELNTYKYDTAWINGALTRDLWNDNTVLGIRIVRDYFLEVQLWYPAHSHKGGEDGYTYWSLGRFNKYENMVTLDSVESTFPFADFIQGHKDDVSSKLKNEFHSLLGEEYGIAHDYDAEMIEEALECGDLDLLEEVVGDRDLAEFI